MRRQLRVKELKIVKACEPGWIGCNVIFKGKYDNDKPFSKISPAFEWGLEDKDFKKDKWKIKLNKQMKTIIQMLEFGVFEKDTEDK